jgi:uncharacterized protein (TIGR00266 family)
MKIDIAARPASAYATITLDAGEDVTCECGAMIAMTPGTTVETTSRSRGGGMMRGLKRMFSKEGFFLNHFTARSPAQQLVIAPTLAGDILHLQVQGTIIAQGGSWLASGPGIEIDTTWQGMASGLFSGQGLFWVKCSGQGDLLLNSFGCIYPIDVDGGYVVDTGHVVAFQDSLQFSIGKANPSLIGSLLGGEGLVCKFSGRGRLWVQSHNPPSFGQALGSKLKPR